jgi:hypothetical protein
MASKYFDRKIISKYLFDQLTGNFLGFLVGLSASGLVSKFFATRSIKNLWGIASKKTVIDKDTFSMLEWIISIIVGFIVFEIITKIVRERIARSYPAFKVTVFRYLIRKNLRDSEGVKLAIRKSLSRDRNLPD